MVAISIVSVNVAVCSCIRKINVNKVGLRFKICANNPKSEDTMY